MSGELIINTNLNTIDEVMSDIELHVNNSMKTAIYDVNGNGIVDNAEKVGGFTVEKDVPIGAAFTDTITTINSKTGVITKADVVALGIPAQDTIYTHPNHSGDVTSVADGATTIAANIVTNTKLADMPVNTIKGRKTSGTGDPEDITITDLKTMLELNNVTNVTQLAASLKGAVNGVAELDSGGKVPSTQLPSYVDDVLECANLAAFPATGTSGIIYIAIDTNKTYRWGGSAYTVISETIALGETSATAYRGDRGKTAYDHSQIAHAPAGATINDTDANLKNRANHTGTQTSSTISDFASTVRDTILTGLSIATNAAITATDSILVAFGKLQKQISDNLTTLTSHINNTSNPHSVTKTQVGLGSVDNTADSAKNVLSATKLTTPRTIALSGDVTGSASFDGSSNISITATVADNSHAHVIGDVTGLQTALSTAVAGSKYAITIGDGTNSVYNITHNLGTQDILVTIIKLATMKNALPAFTIVDANHITIDFGTVIASNTYRVIVL